MKDRLLSLDAIRGIAILLVVMGHIYTFTDGDHTPIYSIVEEFISAVHMPLFIIVAGYFAQKISTGRAWISYIKDKGMRLVLPAVIWYGFWTIWHDGQLHFSGLLANQYWFTLNLFIYFVSFLIQRIVINGLLRGIRQGENRTLEGILHLLGAVGSYYLLAFALPKYSSIVQGMLEMPRMRMACLYPYFVFGFLAGRYQIIPYLRTQLSGAVSFTLLIGCIWYFTYYQMQETYIQYGIFHIYRLMALSLFAFLVFITSIATDQNTRIGKLLVFFGQWSLPIYFIHYYFIPSCYGIHSYLAQYIPSQRIAIELLIYAIGATIAILPSLLVAYGIKKNTYLSWLLFGEKLK